MALIIDDVSKAFNGVPAVDRLSLEVRQGTVFGFLGPNGAGKTTTMRMVLNIYQPDSGTITWQGRPVAGVPRSAWGYMPEDRGLYPKMRVADQLLFLARLYGRPRAAVQHDIDEWLERLQITQNRTKRVDELSKGNQQKIQFLAAILHDPEILIMDEPFSGLDPVNEHVLKDALLEMHRRGKTIIFSTHEMATVEEICEEIAIINRGRIVVAGNVRQIKRAAGRKVVQLALDNDAAIPWLDALPGVTVTRRGLDYVEMHLSTPATPDSILQTALAHGGGVTRFQIDDPSLNDIFIERVGGLQTAGLGSADAPVSTRG
ncbi:MAG TPA: ATP-binding cassette domain-containing protein [Chloroflexia bacterium]|nr:ATP-binding cassette domain-containing protein [Chloroflexia bacterium]